MFRRKTHLHRPISTRRYPGFSPGRLAGSYAPALELGPHPVIRQHVLPVPLKYSQVVQMSCSRRDDPRDVARDIPFLRMSLTSPAEHLRIRLGADREFADVPRNGGAALEHAEGGLALARAVEVDSAIDRGDGLRVDSGGL